MKSIAKIACFSVAVLLAGCWQSEEPLIPADQSAAILPAGEYCQYGYDAKLSEWKEQCDTVMLGVGENNGYTYQTKNSEGKILRQRVRILSTPISTGGFKGYHLVQLCSEDSKPGQYTKACMYAALQTVKPGDYIIRTPNCSGNCVFTDLSAVVSGFETATSHDPTFSYRYKKTASRKGDL